MTLALHGCAAGSSAERDGQRSVIEANRPAASACEAGDANACSMLGTSLYLDAEANNASFEPAVSPLEKACKGGNWHGCGMAALVKSEMNQNGRPIAAKAFPMAMAACRGGDGGACVYVGDWAAKAGDRITAGTHYRTACEMNLEACGVSSMDEYSCRKAVELGAARDQLVAYAGRPTSHAQLEQVHGERDIQPPMPEAAAMHRSRRSTYTARFVLCVSERGTPARIILAERSGAPRWDQRLFETMRTWRYTPYVGESGQPEPVCHGVTFIYRPRGGR